jgi:hypothetical protein
MRLRHYRDIRLIMNECNEEILDLDEAIMDIVYSRHRHFFRDNLDIKVFLMDSSSLQTFEKRKT